LFLPIKRCCKVADTAKVAAGKDTPMQMASRTLAVWDMAPFWDAAALVWRR